MILVKVHENVVAICDSNLIGKIIEDEKRSLNITERFYKGEEKSEKEVIEIMRCASNLNIVGSKSIALALKQGFINKEDIIIIKGVPHAQIYAV